MVKAIFFLKWNKIRIKDIKKYKKLLQESINELHIEYQKKTNETSCIVNY